MKTIRILCLALVAGAAAFGKPVSTQEAKPAVNLLANGSFESWDDGAPAPEGWWFFTSKMGVVQPVDGTACDGERSLRFRAQGAPKGQSGLIQSVPVEGGRVYSFRARVRRYEDDTMRGTVFGQLVIEWKDKDGREIRRVWGRNWPKNLGRRDWDEVSILRAEAPAGAVQGVFGIHLFEGASGGTGSFLVDAVTVTSP